MNIQDMEELIKDHEKLIKIRKTIEYLKLHLTDTLIRIDIRPDINDSNIKALFEVLMDGDTRKRMLKVYYDHLAAIHDTLVNKLIAAGIEI